MANLTFGLNRKQRSLSTGIIVGTELQPGFRVQIREVQIYGQIWEGVVEEQHFYEKDGNRAAFVSLHAIVDVPLGFSEAAFEIQHDSPVVGSGDPNIGPAVVIPPVVEDPAEADPPIVGNPGGQGGLFSVEVIVADQHGRGISISHRTATLFP